MENAVVENGRAPPLGDEHPVVCVNTCLRPLECTTTAAGLPEVYLPEESPEGIKVSLRENPTGEPDEPFAKGYSANLDSPSTSDR